jgi:alkylation response protein AidB-like acyl-CoA dehydrogenase
MTTATPELDVFRGTVTAFLERHATPRVSDTETPATTGGAEGSAVERASRFQRRLFDAGLAGLTWPTRYGGGGLTPEHSQVFNEVAAGYAVPTGPLFIGLGICAPTLLDFGSEELRSEHLPALLRGEEVWCQLFSEPGAGSDLASLSTRAVQDGEEWVITGHKVWTTGAQFSDYAILLARTNVDVPKHRGLTMFAFPMRASGVLVRPLRQITGESGFNEVIMDEVRVPLGAAIGSPGDGWRVAIGTLMHERASIGAGGGATGQRLRRREFPHLEELARERAVTRDPHIREGLTVLYLQERIVELIGLRVRAAAGAGRTPGPEGSVAKLAAGIAARLAGDLVMEIAGPSGIAWMPDDPNGGDAARLATGCLVTGIGGGTTEIQKNIIGERTLGLPREPQVDRDVPYRDLLVGTQAPRD